METKNNNLIKIFCIVSLACFGLLIIVIGITNGEYFSTFFYEDIRDSGMDFFHSIEYVYGAKPYIGFKTLYPPLANFFFYFILQMVPNETVELFPRNFDISILNRGTNSDLRTYQSAMIIFIGFILIVEIGLVIFVAKKILNRNMKYAFLTPFCVMLSYGNLFAIERGNIIILAVLLTIIFLEYYKSENKMLKEFSLVALALATGLKLYPAIFGLLLLKNKQWRDAIRCVVYGIVFSVIPLFIFKGSLIENLKIFISVLVNFVDGNIVQGLGLEALFGQVELFINRYMGIEIYFSTRLVKIIILVIVLILIVSFFILKSKWKETLCLVIALLLFSNIGTYGLMFIIIPFLGIIMEERIINREILIPYFGVLILMAPFPYFNWIIRTAIWQGILILIFLWIIIDTISHIKNNLHKSKKIIISDKKLIG